MLKMFSLVVLSALQERLANDFQHFVLSLNFYVISLSFRIIKKISGNSFCFQFKLNLISYRENYVTHKMGWLMWSMGLYRKLFL